MKEMSLEEIKSILEKENKYLKEHIERKGSFMDQLRHAISESFKIFNLYEDYVSEMDIFTFKTECSKLKEEIPEKKKFFFKDQYFCPICKTKLKKGWRACPECRKVIKW